MHHITRIARRVDERESAIGNPHKERWLERLRAEEFGARPSGTHAASQRRPSKSANLIQSRENGTPAAGAAAPPARKYGAPSKSKGCPAGSCTSVPGPRAAATTSEAPPPSGIKNEKAISKNKTGLSCQTREEEQKAASRGRQDNELADVGEQASRENEGACEPDAGHNECRC